MAVQNHKRLSFNSICRILFDVHSSYDPWNYLVSISLAIDDNLLKSKKAIISIVRNSFAMINLLSFVEKPVYR